MTNQTVEATKPSIPTPEQLDRIFKEVRQTSVGEQVFGSCGGAAIRSIIATVISRYECIQDEVRVTEMVSLSRKASERRASKKEIK